MAEKTKAKKRASDSAPQAPPEEPIIPEEEPEPEAPAEEEPKEVIEPEEAAGAVPSPQHKEEPAGIDKAEAAPERSVTKESKGTHDCRGCLHYPLMTNPSTSSLVEDIKMVTNGWRLSYCGKQPKRHGGPLDGKVVNPHINCIGKTFTKVK